MLVAGLLVQHHDANFEATAVDETQTGSHMYLTHAQSCNNDTYILTHGYCLV